MVADITSAVRASVSPLGSPLRSASDDGGAGGGVGAAGAAYVPLRSAARLRAGGAAYVPALDGTLPPSGNTGVGITTGGTPRSLPASEGPNRAARRRVRPDSGLGAGVGWLSCTWKGYFASLDDFMTWAGSFFGGLEYCEGRRWRGYDHIFMGEHGLMVGVRWDADRLEVHRASTGEVGSSTTVHEGPLLV